MNDSPKLRRMTQAQRSRLSDHRMLQASIRLLVERGPEGTTLKDVGEHAGYSRGLAGHRFGSKAGLFDFILHSLGDDWLSSLTRVTDGLVGLDAINAATDEHLRFCHDAPDHVRAFYLLWFESLGPMSGLKHVVSSIHDRRRRDVARWIRAAQLTHVDADAVAAQFCASIVGIVYHWLQHPDDIDEVSRLHENLKLNMSLLLSYEPIYQQDARARS